MSKSMFFCFSLIACGLSGYGAYAGTYMQGTECGGQMAHDYPGTAPNLPFIRLYEDANECDNGGDTQYRRPV